MPPKKKSKTEENLVWTDDEVELLLETTKEFKVKKAYETIDWESVKEKYEKIRELFTSNLPDETNEKFPHVKESFTKVRITTKIKQIRGNYRKALDTGKQSGGGRIVATFYDICNEIWSGSPATEAIASGIETDISTAETRLGNAENETENVSNVEDLSDETNENIDDSLQSSITETSLEETDETENVSSRERMKIFLDNRRNKKIEKNIPKKQQEKQAEDSVQKKLLEQMERQDKSFNDAMKALQNNMTSLTQAMTGTFQMLAQSMENRNSMMNQSFFSPPQTPSAHFYNGDAQHYFSMHNMPRQNNSAVGNPGNDNIYNENTDSESFHH